MVQTIDGNLIMLFEDQEFLIQSLDLKLKRVHGKGYRCKCPICDDHKERLYFLKKDQQFHVYCHNCQYSSSLKNFIKNQYPHLFNDFFPKTNYVKKQNRLLNKQKGLKIKSIGKRTFNFFNEYESIKGNPIPISQLSSSHEAKKYIVERRIPEKFYKYFFYTDDFTYIASLYGQKTEKWPKNNKRIIIAHWDMDKKLTFIQGRAIDPMDKLRYITITVKDNSLKIFGLDSVDCSLENIFITEGAFDSVFLPNSLAISGSHISNDKILEILKVDNPKKIVFVFDNEPENKEIVNEMENKINFGFSVVIWNRFIFREKDINNMVLADNFNFTDFKNCIFNGVSAKNKLKRWNVRTSLLR
jgi:hypothetical protein